MSKKKQTLMEELSHRKFHQTNRFFYWIYKLIMVDIIAKKRYNIHIEDVDGFKKKKGPAIILFNHLSRIDHVYVLAATYPRRFNMLAEYNEFFRSHLKLAFKLNNVIPKKNYYSDIQSIKGMSSILRKGGTVAIAPEGLCSSYGTNKPIVPGTGKLLKKFGVPVYFCRLDGCYLQNTKVCLEERKGQTFARISLLYDKEALDNKSVEEIDNEINNLFYSDEYKWNKEKHIKWETHGHICQSLEQLLYKCPKCGKEFTMKGIDDHIECTSCSNAATMDDYYEFHPYNEDCVIPESPLVWCDNERMDVIKEIRKDDNYQYQEECEIGNLDAYKPLKDYKTSKIVGKGIMTINHSGFHYQGTRNEEDFNLDMSWQQLYTIITVKDASYFSFYYKGEYFEFYPKSQAVGKILFLIEEMHRYHINFYKNFSWYDYMYEGLECGIDNKK